MTAVDAVRASIINHVDEGEVPDAKHLRLVNETARRP
jgi:hypothetical protein